MKAGRDGLSVVGRLTVAIATQATPQDLADLDAEIARLQAFRELLAEALRLIGEPKAAPVAKPAKVPAGNVVRPAANKPGPKVSGELHDGRRRQIASWLAAEGLTTDQITVRLKIARSSVVVLMQHEWFVKTSRRSPWELTEVGRTESAATAASRP